MRTLGLIQWFKALSGWRMKRVLRFCGSLFLVTLLVAGCAHYPINQPVKEVHPNAGYRAAQVKDPQNSDHMLLFLTFSGVEQGRLHFPTGFSKNFGRQR